MVAEHPGEATQALAAQCHLTACPHGLTVDVLDYDVDPEIGPRADDF
jgi:hypothetical protein